jgi:hypothetical protein
MIPLQRKQCLIIYQHDLAINFNVAFEVLTAVAMKSVVSWNITPCSTLKVNLRFGGTYRLQLATSFHAGFLLSLFFRPWSWRRHVPPKRLLTLNGLHGVMSQKIVFFNFNNCLRIIPPWTQVLLYVDALSFLTVRYFLFGTLHYDSFNIWNI